MKKKKKSHSLFRLWSFYKFSIIQEICYLYCLSKRLQKSHKRGISNNIQFECHVIIEISNFFLIKYPITSEDFTEAYIKCFNTFRDSYKIYI